MWYIEIFVRKFLSTGVETEAVPMHLPVVIAVWTNLTCSTMFLNDF